MHYSKFTLLSLKTTFFVLYSVLKSWLLFFIPKSYLFKSVKQKIILITGAGSGLGAALAVKFAKRKARLVLWDINKDGLERTMEQCRKYQSENYIATFQVDVSDRKQVLETAEKIKSSIGFVDILINNAGIVSGKRVIELTTDSVQRIFGVNVFSHIWTVQAFLPEMMERNSGHIVSISSMAAYSGLSKMTDYCATKSAASGFQESLMFEIMAENKFGIKTLAVCPFYINTGMFDGVKTDCPILPILEVDYAASEIEAAILTDASILIIPRICYFLLFLKSFLPTEAMVAVLDLTGANHSMDNFKGRH